MVVAEGKKAPDFTLTDASGKPVSLSDFKGQSGFRDLNRELQKAGVVVLGVSADSGASPAAFAGKHRLPFTLLSDPDRTVMTAWGAYGDKMMYAKKTTGVIRSTVWIGPDGVVRKHWRKVPDAAKHPGQVWQAVRGGQGS